MLSTARYIVLGIIDFFHKPFSRIIPTQTFRYLACGGSNAVLNIFMYHMAYNHILHKQDTHMFGLTMSARVIAWVIAFVITFPIGFTLSRHIVFPESNLHGRIQFFRYALTTLTFIFMNYVGIKFFELYLNGIPPTLSYTFVNIITAVLSYISQRKFTFKSVAGEEEPIAEEVLNP